MQIGETSHRPWPLPAGPWAMAMCWHDLLFAHWPIPADVMRPHIPAGLDLDTFDGSAWLGVVPFRMSGVRTRGVPALPWFSAFPELNVRTYVIADDAGDASCSASGLGRKKPGVWFFSLDAANPVAVEVARRWYSVPYFHARMKCVERGGWIEYASRRSHARRDRAAFRARYRPVGDAVRSQPGTLEYFLTERYCLYTARPNALLRRVAAGEPVRICRGEIHHAPWPLQPAEAELEVNSVAEAAGFELPVTPPLLHFARRLDVVAWALRPVEEPQ